MHFVPYVHGYDFTRADLDCSILFGLGHWPGASAEYLTGRKVTLIAPPPVLQTQRIKKAQDVARYVLLHHITVPDAWKQWCSAHGVGDINAFAGPQLDQYHSLIRAVAVGMRVALVPHCLVKDDIAAGVISAPLSDGYESAYGYWICYPESRAGFDPLVRFKTWLLGEFRQE